MPLLSQSASGNHPDVIGHSLRYASSSTGVSWNDACSETGGLVIS